MTAGRGAAERAEALALQALAFIAADEERFRRFLLSTGTTAEDVRRRAADPDFLSGVYDHMLADEPLLMAFAEEAGVEPSAVAAARYRLPGAVME
ncbi:MAG: DUF3572 family protein [Gammaproteobacteria bacterium]|jgi:hypothetical protein